MFLPTNCCHRLSPGHAKESHSVSLSAAGAAGLGLARTGPHKATQQEVGVSAPRLLEVAAVIGWHGGFWTVIG